jgi:hypothetical protein
MPRNYHITDHFTVMDTSEKAVFLYVSDHKMDDPVGNLFISDGQGSRFTHSLENIIKGGGAVDFEAIESMDGTFIANRYDANHGTTWGNDHAAGKLREITAEDIAEAEQAHGEHSRMSANTNKKQSNTEAKTLNSWTKNRLEQFNDKIKTYITHNKGASWELIRAPETDMNGKSLSCHTEDDCSLHLHMYSNNANNYAPPYSQESAVGVVMAVGHYGEKLDFDFGAKRGTYLSRDGGVKWAQVAQIPLIYEFGDFGGLLVAAPNTVSTKRIRYSWNEGKTWTKLDISDVPIYVENIIIESKSTSQQFVIYGTYAHDDEDSNTEAAWK